VLNKDQMKKLS